MSTPWLLRHVSPVEARVRLFCFPYAGVGASVYRLWPAGLPPEVEVCAIQLPGREGRLRESPMTSIHAMTQALLPELLPWFDRPFAFFGHSMGAILAAEVARSLRATGLKTPGWLMVSGRRAPHLPDSEPRLTGLPDEQFVSEINRRFGGIPAQVMEDRELMALLLPTLRADIVALEGYLRTDASAFDFPVAVFGGLDDARADRKALDAWRAQTTSDFRLRMFPGDHFYLNPRRADLLAEVTSILAPLLAEHRTARATARSEVRQ